MDKKALSYPILLSLVVGNMIGTGIYMLPASLAEYGTIAIFAWVLTSIGAIFLALTFVKLNSRYPKTGGPYLYCREAFGNLVGFIIAYTYWFSNLVSIAGIAVSSVGYLGFISVAFDANNPAYNQTQTLLFELAAVWGFACVNILGLHAAGVVQLFLTIIKIIPLLLIIFLGFHYIHFDNLTQWVSGNQSAFGALSGAATLTFWAFIGLESATVPAENTQGAKDISRATIFGTLATATIYILSTIVLMGMLSIAELKNSQFPFADAATVIFGEREASILAICAVISGLGALNVCILVQGQIVFAAARNHLFPKAFAKLSKHDVPIAAQLLSACLVTLLLISTIQPTLLAQFNNIALLAGFLTLITYFMSMLAEVKLLIVSNQSITSAIFSKSMLITLLAAAYTIWMMFSLNKQILLSGCILVLCCIPIYFFSVRKYVRHSAGSKS